MLETHADLLPSLRRAFAAYPSDEHINSPTVQGLISIIVAGNESDMAAYADAHMSEIDLSGNHGTVGTKGRFLKVCGACFAFWNYWGNPGGQECESNFCLAVLCIGYE